MCRAGRRAPAAGGQGEETGRGETGEGAEAAGPSESSLMPEPDGGNGKDH